MNRCKVTLVVEGDEPATFYVMKWEVTKQGCLILENEKGVKVYAPGVWLALHEEVVDVDDN